MRVGIISVFMDYHRRGGKNRGVLQPGIGPAIAAMLPRDVEVEVVNESWADPDFTRDYDLLYISAMHPDFDRARQISHYWRRRGARTVFGGIMASTYPDLCQPFFDSVVVGDAEGTARAAYDDFCRGELKPRYLAARFDASAVPAPRYELLAGRHPVPLTLEASRGCPFSCEFCALTAQGTRFHPRPPEAVAADILAGQEALRGHVPWWRRKAVGFVDNNIGGNPAVLRRLCDALEPLGVLWGAPITFNALNAPGMVERMAAAGCRSVFVGLETFNPAALHDMNKHQNALAETRALIDRCRANGIMLLAGLMLSPTIDDARYIESIPRRLREAGLHVPEFVCFEGPIPGTPYFRRLAAEPEPAFLPNAYLRDITGYTLVVRPRHETVETFVEGYRHVVREIYSPLNLARKVADDALHYLPRGRFFAATASLVHQFGFGDMAEDPDRTYVAATDRAPPEAFTVPLEDDDFDDEDERRAVIEPWRVTDERGHVLPTWRGGIKVFDPKGRITREAVEASGVLAAAG
jgi:hypothetical protein